MKPIDSQSQLRSQLLKEGYEQAFSRPELTTDQARATWAVAYAEQKLKEVCRDPPPIS